MPLFLYFWACMGTTYEDRDPKLNYDCVPHPWNDETCAVMRYCNCQYYSGYPSCYSVINLQEL